MEGRGWPHGVVVNFRALCFGGPGSQVQIQTQAQTYTTRQPCCGGDPHIKWRKMGTDVRSGLIFPPKKKPHYIFSIFLFFSKQSYGMEFSLILRPITCPLNFLCSLYKLHWQYHVSNSLSSHSTFTQVRLWSSPSAVLSLLALLYSNLSLFARLLEEVDGKGPGNWNSVECFEHESDICNQTINLVVFYKMSHGRLLHYS